MQLFNFTLPLGLGWMLSSGQSRLESIQQSFLPSGNKSITSVDMAYKLPPLPYSYDALEPYFDQETMEIHHTGHHQAYVNNLNAALEGDELCILAVDDLITKLDQVPADKRSAVRSQGGGHSNHSFFWKNLKTGTTLSGPLQKAIENWFGSFESFQQQFEKAALSVFGSGWAWLVKNNDGSLRICTTANQDSPLMGEAIAGCSGYPIIGLDVWEHAYYLSYRNKRPNYVKAYWNVVNWDDASERFKQNMCI